MDDDDDEIDEDGAQYIEKLEKSAAEDDSDDEYDDEAEETALESFQTPLDLETCRVDEYQVFKNTLLGNHIYNELLTSIFYIIGHPWSSVQ